MQPTRVSPDGPQLEVLGWLREWFGCWVVLAKRVSVGPIRVSDLLFTTTRRVIEMAVLGELAERFGYTDLGVAALEVEIPVLTGLQRQGDILVMPWRPVAEPPAEWLVPVEGFIVMGGVSGHCHTLHGAGQALDSWWLFEHEGISAWLVREIKALEPQPHLESLLTVLHVPAGGEAFLMHSDEHGALGIGPGWYQLRSQLEYIENDWVGVLD